MIKIIELKNLGAYRLYLVFSDGTKGKVNLSKTITQGVFKSLKDESEFSKVVIGNKGRTIVWPNEIDLCADSLYQQITGNLPSPIKNSSFLDPIQAEILRDIDVRQQGRSIPNMPVRTIVSVEVI